jgi:hypothetical protein
MRPKVTKSDTTKLCYLLLSVVCCNANKLQQQHYEYSVFLLVGVSDLNHLSVGPQEHDPLQPLGHLLLLLPVRTDADDKTTTRRHVAGNNQPRQHAQHTNQSISLGRPPTTTSCTSLMLDESIVFIQKTNVASSTSQGPKAPSRLCFLCIPVFNKAVNKR